MRQNNSAGVAGGWAEGLACADPGARAPIGANGILKQNDLISQFKFDTFDFNQFMIHD